MAYKEITTAANADPRPGSRPARRAKDMATMKAKSMWRLFRLLLVILLFGGLGLIGFSYSGYLVPKQESVTAPVVLDAN